MPNRIRPAAPPNSHNQQPEAPTAARRQGPITRSSTNRAAAAADRLATQATPSPSVTPPHRFVAAPQAPARRRTGLLSTEALARIQRTHNALFAATSETGSRPDVRIRDVLFDTEYDIATPTPRADGSLPPPRVVPAPELWSAGRTLLEAYDAYTLAASTLQGLQPNTRPDAVSRSQAQEAPLVRAELTAGLPAFSDDHAVNMGQRAVMQSLGAGLRPPDFINPYVVDLHGIAAQLATRLSRRGSPHLAIVEALEDIPRWYAQLPANGVIELTPTQAQTHRCSISHEPFDQLTHPVGIYSGDVLHVFEGVDLLTWMKHQTAPRSDDDVFMVRVATHPLTRQPLHLASLQRVRMQTRDEV